MNEPVVLDACVLVPYNLSSVLLTLAEGELYEPRWSERILDETERTLIHKLGRPAEKVARRLEAMRAAFPEAAVHGFEPMEDGLTCDPKDRHVLAAAIVSNATIIVTANLDDFPVVACSPYDVVAVHPEQFLFMLLSEDAPACAAAIARDAARRSRPPMTTGDLLASITDIAPTFANTMHHVMLGRAQPGATSPRM